MVPTNAFSALLERLRELSDRKPELVNEAQTARLMAEWSDSLSRIEPPKHLFHRQNRVLLISLALMLSPFVLGTGYLCYQSIWFVYGANRAVGKVVEITNDALPSLVIEYRPKNAKTLRVESDGSESYSAFNVGDTLTVFYDPSDPENARPDLFLELWVMPIIMGFVTCIVLLAVVLIARAATAPMLRM